MYNEEVVEEEQTAIKITHLDKETRGISIPICINNVATKAVVDTGADATVVSEDIAKEVKLDFKTGKKCKLLNAANNAEMVAYGGVTATLQIGKKIWNWPVYVAPIRDGVLLGIDFLQGSNLSPTEKSKFLPLVSKYQKIFAINDLDLGCFKSIKHKINTNQSRPIRQPTRRTPLSFQKEEQEHLRKMLDTGVVVPS